MVYIYKNLIYLKILNLCLKIFLYIFEFIIIPKKELLFIFYAKKYSLYIDFFVYII